MTEKDVKCAQCTPDTIEKLLSNTDETITWCNCENCDTWIHAICDEMTKEEAEKTSKYYCKKCRNKEKSIKQTSVNTNNTERKVSKFKETSKKDDKKSTNKNNVEIPIKNNIENDDDDNVIIPNSQENDESKVKNSNENIFSHKKTPENEEKDKSEALQHRTKTMILKEYKKLEVKMKEREEKFKEKVEKIEQLNGELQKIRDEQSALNETIKSLTEMKNKDEQTQIRTAIEAQRNSEKKVTEISADNQRLKKNNTEKQTEIRKLKEHNNKLEESVNEIRAKYEKEYKENITLNKLIELTNASKKSIEELDLENKRMINEKEELLIKEIAKNATQAIKINQLEKELKVLAEEKYRKIDPDHERRKLNKENSVGNVTLEAMTHVANTDFQPQNNDQIITEDINETDPKKDSLGNETIIAMTNMINTTFQPQTHQSQIAENTKITDTNDCNLLSENTMINILNSSEIPMPAEQESNEKSVCEFVARNGYQYIKQNKSDKIANKFYEENKSQNNSDENRNLYPKVIIKQTDKKDMKQMNKNKEKRRIPIRSRSRPRCMREDNRCRRANHEIPHQKRQEVTRRSHSREIMRKGLRNNSKNQRHSRQMTRMYHSSDEYHQSYDKHRHNSRRRNHASKRHHHETEKYNHIRPKSHHSPQRNDRIRSRHCSPSRHIPHRSERSRHRSTSRNNHRRHNIPSRYDHHSHERRYKAEKPYHRSNYRNDERNKYNSRRSVELVNEYTKKNAKPHNEAPPTQKSHEENDKRTDNISTRIIVPSREAYKTKQSENSSVVSNSNICKFYQQRRCKFGNQCYNLHIENSEKVVTTKSHRSINTNPRL